MNIRKLNDPHTGKIPGARHSDKAKNTSVKTCLSDNNQYGIIVEIIFLSGNHF
jgi:hypothetical protein